MSAPISTPRAPSRPHHRPSGRATRSRLVRAALELFTEQGFRATTTPELARRAGVAEATIYRHFSGKEALLNAAARDAVAWGLSLVSAGETEHRLDAEVALGLIGRELVQMAEQDPALVRMLLRPPEESLHEEGTRQAIRDFRVGLQQIMAAGKQRGRIRPGSAELWAAVWLALAGFVAERVAAKEWGVDHPNVELALESAWQAVVYRMPDTPLEMVT
jgi:AcrR family transcriptional regulator